MIVSEKEFQYLKCQTSALLKIKCVTLKFNKNKTKPTDRSLCWLLQIQLLSRAYQVAWYSLCDAARITETVGIRMFFHKVQESENHICCITVICCFIVTQWTTPHNIRMLWIPNFPYSLIAYNQGYGACTHGVSPTINVPSRETLIHVEMAYKSLEYSWTCWVVWEVKPERHWYSLMSVERYHIMKSYK